MSISSKQFFSKGKVTVLGQEAEMMPRQDNESIFQSAYSKVKQVGGNIFEDIKKRGQNIGETASKVGSGGIDPFSFAVQTVGQAAGGVGDVVADVAKGALPSRIKEPIKGVINSVASTQPAQDAMAKYAEFKAKYPTAAADLEGIVNIASLFPIGKGGQIAEEAVTKAAGTVAKGVVSPAADLLTTTGRGLKGAGETFYKSAITPTAKEAQRLLEYEAKTPFLTRVSNTLSGIDSQPITRSKTALEKGLAGTEKMIGVQAKRLENKLWKGTIEPALKGSEDRLTKDELFASALRRIEETVEPGKKQAYRDAMDLIEEEYKNFADTDLLTSNKIKSQLDEFTPEKVFRGKPIGSEYTQLRADMANAIREKIYNSLKDQNIKRDFLDYSNLKELEKVGVKAISEGGFKGGFGNFWTSMWDAVTTPVKTIGGQVLYRVGNKLEFIGQKGLKRFGDYLQSKGFENPSVGLSVKNVGQVRVPGQAPVDVNMFAQEPGAYPKSLARFEKPMTDLEQVGFQKSPIISNRLKGDDAIPTQLAQEAKKYATAEEFVKAQAKKDYVLEVRKTTVNDIAKVGTYGEAGSAKTSARRKLASDITDKEIEIAQRDQKLFDTNKNKTIEQLQNEITETKKWADENNTSYPRSIQVKEEIIKTKSQLIDIWNKANKPTIDPLIQEAKKYKSAEEFVKAQQKNVVYHGSSAGPLEKFDNKKGGAFFTSSMEDASGYAGNPDNVYEGYLNFKKPLVIDAKGAKWDNLNTKFGKTTQEIVSNAKKAGYDGVTFKNIVDNIMDTEGMGESTVHYAIKPADTFINESQLTDIWKKANKKPKR